MAEKHPVEESDRLEQWFDFTQKLYSTLDLEDASKIALGVALRFTGLQRGMLFTHDKDQRLRLRCAQNQTGKSLNQEELPAPAAFIAEASKTLSPMHRIVHADSVKTALCIPLVSSADSKVIGALYMDSPESIPYTEQAKETVRMFLMHAGPALETVILYDWATKDPLTELYQRHYFDAHSHIEWRRTLRHKHPTAVLKIDVNHLREINDEHGRSEGDLVLQKTAQILREICRTEDLIARYDVDEFAVLLAETDTNGARMVSNRICEEVPLLLTRDPEKPVTVSIGGAAFPRCSVNSILDLMKLADIALYQSKQTGGKRPIIYEPSLTSAHKKVF